MGCCVACESDRGSGSNGLGESSVTQPRRLSDNEIQAFLIYHQDDMKLQRYLNTGEPSWGLIVDSFGAEILVWRSDPNPQQAESELFVIDVTGNPIVDEVKKAPYVSPDDTGFWENFNSDIDNVLGEVGFTLDGIVAMASAVLILYGAWELVRG